MEVGYSYSFFDKVLRITVLNTSFSRDVPIFLFSSSSDLSLVSNLAGSLPILHKQQIS